MCNAYPASESHPRHLGRPKTQSRKFQDSRHESIQILVNSNTRDVMYSATIAKAKTAQPARKREDADQRKSEAAELTQWDATRGLEEPERFSIFSKTHSKIYNPASINSPIKMY